MPHMSGISIHQIKQPETPERLCIQADVQFQPRFYFPIIISLSERFSPLPCSQFRLHCTRGSGRHGAARQTVSFYPEVKERGETKGRLEYNNTSGFREWAHTCVDVWHDAVKPESSFSLLQFNLGRWGGITLSSLTQLRGQDSRTHSSLQQKAMW